MLALDPVLLEAGLGVFFLVIIPIRRWMITSGFRISWRGMAAAGAAVGFLTGIVANTGPVNTPFFLAFGLLKGAFVGTEAMASLAMFGSKTMAFWAFAALSLDILLSGMIVGATLMLGAWLAKSLVYRLDAERFNLLMDGLLAVAGVSMIASAALAL